MSKSAIGTSKTIYEICSMLNAQRLSFRWCKVTEILKIWLLWQIWRINLPYKKRKGQPSDFPYYQQVETSEKKSLFYEFSYEFAIRMLINIEFQTTIFLQKNGSRPDRSIYGFIRPVHEVYQFLQTKAHIFCSEKSKKGNRASGLCFTSILHQLWAGKRNGHP